LSEATKGTKNALTDWKPFEENSFPNHCNGKNNPPASDFPAVLTVQVFSDFELPAIGRNPTNRRQSHSGWQMPCTIGMKIGHSQKTEQPGLP
jgi:hypothetical protein